MRGKCVSVVACDFEEICTDVGQHGGKVDEASVRDPAMVKERR